MRHYTSHICPRKLHSCMSLVRVSKVVFDQLFANVGSIGPALALEAANERLCAQGAVRIFLIGDVHELC